MMRDRPKDPVEIRIAIGQCYRRNWWGLREQVIFHEAAGLGSRTLAEIEDDELHAVLAALEKFHMLIFSGGDT